MTKKQIKELLFRKYSECAKYRSHFVKGFSPLFDLLIAKKRYRAARFEMAVIRGIWDEVFGQSKLRENRINFERNMQEVNHDNQTIT